MTRAAIAARVSGPLGGFAGKAYAYEVDPPMVDQDKAYHYVIVSAVDLPVVGPETFIFGALKAGTSVMCDTRRELEGSYRGALDHDRALRNAGYTVADRGWWLK